MTHLASYAASGNKQEFLTDIQSLKEYVETFMVPENEEDLRPVHFSPTRMEDVGSIFLTLSEISAKIVTYGNLKKTPDNRRLGAIMTKLGFEKERRGHNNRCGYYVREHTEAEKERLRHPEIFIQFYVFHGKTQKRVSLGCSAQRPHYDVPNNIT